jgi:Cytochrome P450
VIPNTYLGRIRDTDPVHWNAQHEVWIVTRYDDMLAFARNSGERERYSEPDGFADLTVEDCLRYDPPVKSLERVARTDMELGGKLICAGDRVRWFVSSANHDPQRFASPETSTSDTHQIPMSDLGAADTHGWAPRSQGSKHEKRSESSRRAIHA